MGMRIRSVYHSGLIALGACMDDVSRRRDYYIFGSVHLRAASSRMALATCEYISCLVIGQQYDKEFSMVLYNIKMISV